MVILQLYFIAGPVGEGHGYGYHGVSHGFEGGGGFYGHGGFMGHGFAGHGGYHEENAMAREFTPENPGVPTPEPMPESGLNGPESGMNRIHTIY